MADVSRSVSLSKKLSNAGDFNSKHMYDGVFSAPTAKNLNSTAFSVGVEDYREIFSPSDASLGSLIPILDLPAVDPSYIVGRGRSSGVDYAGVFGGLGDDDRIGVPAEELFAGSKTKAKSDAPPSRSLTQIKIPALKSQEFIRDSRNCQESKSPAKTRVAFSKSQEFFGTSGDSNESSSASTRQQVDSVKNVNVSHQKTNQLRKDDAAGMTHIPHLHAASKSPAKTRMTLSKSQEFCGSSRNNQTSSSASTRQEFHGVKHFDVPHQKTDQLSEDDAAEMTHINSKNTHMFDAVGPPRKSGLDKETCMSMDDADFSMKVGKGKRQEKHAKAVSDLSTDKQINDHDVQLQKEFGGGEHYTFDATRSTREANLKSQTFSASTLSSVPQLFDSSDYFRRSSSQGSKSSTNNLHSHAAAGSSSPLLEEELDVNSVAAVSAAVMKRAIEEAEAKIRWAKEFLKGQEGDGSTKLTFKDILKVKTTSTPYHFNEACGLEQNKAVDDDKLLKRKSRSNATATSESSNFKKAGGSKLKDDLNFRATTESQVADEAGVLNEKLHGATAQEYTGTNDCVGSRSTCPAETFEETHDSLDQAVSVNDAELKEKAYSHDVPKSTELSRTYEGGGEWEAAKHLSQLFSGVKNRFVSFISKQADTKKIVIQEDIPSDSGAVEQSEGSTYQVQDVETRIKRAPNQDHPEKVVEMNYYASSGVGEIAQDSDGIGMEIHKSEENEVKRTVALEQGKVEDVTTSPDVEMLVSQQCDPSEPEQELNQIEGLESIDVEGELIQDDVQDQGQEISDDYVGRGCEKGQMGSNERVELNMTQEATYQSSGYDSKEETNCNVKNETGKCVQDQEPVLKGVDESFDGKDGTRRQEEACNERETEMPEDFRKTLEDVEMVEETCTDELQKSVQEAKLCTREDNKTIEQQGIKSKLTVGLVEVADDTSEQDEHVAVAHDVYENDESLVLSKDEEACLHDERSQYAQQWVSSSGGEGMMAEPATSPFKPEMKVEQPATQLVREDMCEQRSRSVEVADDVLEHDVYFPAMGHICQQEQSSLRRNKETHGCDDTDQDPQDVDFTTFEKERMAESTSINSETEGNLEQPSSVHTVSDLIGKEMCEQTGCSINVADETLDHEGCPLADLCQKEGHPCLNGDNEGYAHDDHNTNGHAQDAKFSFEDERMTESTTVTSEPECNVEEPSSVQTIAKLILEEMTETSISARDWEDFDIFEEEIENASEILPRKNIQKTQCETVVDAGQKHANEETSATDIGSENQWDDSEVRTDIEADMASDQDTKMHDADISCKRKRWFENKDEAEEFRRSSVLLGAEITHELDEENSQGSKADDRVEIHIDEKVNESWEGTNVRQTDAGINLEDGPHCTEATHRRRRWFENRGQEVLHNPSVFEGARMTTQMDDQIAVESELDDSLQNCADKEVNEGNKGINVREYDVARDQVESRATADAAHRRRRWFESGEKLGSAQRPSILEDDGVKTDQEFETEMGEDTAKHDRGLGEVSTSGIMENKHQNELNNKEKEKERERVAVDRAIREARQRAFVAQERAAVEARQKAAATAQTRQRKDSSEAKSGSDKASMDAKLKAERAAVERATVEARERALQKAVSEKAAYKSKEKDPKNHTSGPSFNSGYSSAPFANEKSSGAVSESPQRRKAISERNRRTMERAAKALEEKNMRDYLVQKEQAERNRFADALAADIKRWLTGKEGNLPAMLSTLQYILGPDSGWQPIPLTDLVTSTTAVRKAYKRAALCVHPDKLQQRGATTQQKYICEKVFDLLKDAWHKFNSDDR